MSIMFGLAEGLQFVVFNFVAGIWSWLGLSSHATGAIVHLACLILKLESPMKWPQPAQFGPMHILFIEGFCFVLFKS
jgi:hypothetical protein